MNIKNLLPEDKVRILVAKQVAHYASGSAPIAEGALKLQVRNAIGRVGNIDSQNQDALINEAFATYGRYTRSIGADSELAKAQCAIASQQLQTLAGPDVEATLQRIGLAFEQTVAHSAAPAAPAPAGTNAARRLISATEQDSTELDKHLEMLRRKQDGSLALFGNLSRRAEELRSAVDSRIKEIFGEPTGSDLAAAEPVVSPLPPSVEVVPQATPVAVPVGDTQQAPAKVETAEKPAEAKPQRTKEEILADLDSLVGLEEAKEAVRGILEKVEFDKYLIKNNLPLGEEGRNIMLRGGPGSGKTTVARLIGELLCVSGVLKKGHLIEKKKEDLVAGYQGQTEIKTRDAFMEALDGILFIDEAYRLTGEEKEGQGYGTIALQTLLPLMSDYRDRIVVIFAGYKDRMDEFGTANPGIPSRIDYYIDCHDYDTEQLMQILKGKMKKAGNVWGEGAYDKALDVLSRIERDDAFANGRTVLKHFERWMVNKRSRVLRDTPKNTEPTVEALTTITRADINELKDYNYRAKETTN